VTTRARLRELKLTTSSKDAKLLAEIRKRAAKRTDPTSSG
jgi:hypothetical protein